MPGQTWKMDFPPFHIRPYQAEDRQAVRDLCCATGFLGQPIDPVFEDRELFADYLTNYYLEKEPESSLVILFGTEVKGYLLGARHCKRQKKFDLAHNPRLFLRGLAHYGRYNPASKKFVRWILCNGWREVPEAPKNIPHFHINLLPEARNLPTTRNLTDRFLAYLVDCGETQVFGQMVTYADRRGTRLFERYGFRVLNRAEITKYRDFYSGQVFLTTVLKDLTENSQLYGSRLSGTEVSAG